MLNQCKLYSRQTIYKRQTMLTGDINYVIVCFFLLRKTHLFFLLQPSFILYSWFTCVYNVDLVYSILKIILFMFYFINYFKSYIIFSLFSEEVKLFMLNSYIIYCYNHNDIVISLTFVVKWVTILVILILHGIENNKLN